MKAVVTNCSRQIPSLGTYFGELQYDIGRPETKQDFFAKDGDVEFDIRMTSYNGFYIPVDCDVEMEIKFTIIPKPQSPTIKTFK